MVHILQLAAERVQADLLQRNTWSISYNRRQKENTPSCCSVIHGSYLNVGGRKRMPSCCNVIHGSYLKVGGRKALSAC